MKKIGLFPFDNDVIQCLEMFSMYQYSSHILKFKEVEKQGFYCQDIKSHPSARNVRNTRAMLKGNVGILKEDGMYPNPSTLWWSCHFPHLPRGMRQIRFSTMHSAEGLFVYW